MPDSRVSLGDGDLARGDGVELFSREIHGIQLRRGALLRRGKGNLHAGYQTVMPDDPVENQKDRCKAKRYRIGTRAGILAKVPTGGQAAIRIYSTAISPRAIFSKFSNGVCTGRS
jgi:hypothetical protein